MLELRDLVKHYQVGGGEPIRAVDGVSMTIGAGEFVALYGPSGSGKTTLLELIAGLREPDSGSVLVEGRDVVAMSRREADEYRLRQLGIVGQPQNLIPGAQGDPERLAEAADGERAQGAATVEPLLGQLGLGERLQHRTEQLSMGERQRVLIALALSTEAQARARRRADREPRHPAHPRGARPAARSLPRAADGAAARHPRSAGGRVRRPGARTARRASRRIQAGSQAASAGRVAAGASA